MAGTSEPLFDWGSLESQHGEEVSEEAPGAPASRRLLMSGMDIPLNIAVHWEENCYGNPSNEPLRRCDETEQIHVDERACLSLLKAVCRSLAETTELEYGKERSAKVLFLFESLLYPIEPVCLGMSFRSMRKPLSYGFQFNCTGVSRVGWGRGTTR